MLMSEEMKRMAELFNRYDEELKAPGIVRSYIAPNIPEKVLQRLVKHYDNHLAANSVVAYYDDTLFGSAKSGLIFTTDGFYYKPIGKAMSQLSNVMGITLLNQRVKSSRFPLRT